MYRKLFNYRHSAEEPNAVCCCCGDTIAPGIWTVAEAETPGFGAGRTMTRRSPDNFDLVKRYWDEDCFESNYRQCEDCGRYEHVEEMRWVDREDREVCGNCLSENYILCDQCGEYVPIRDAYTDDFDNVVCTNCYDTYDYNFCDDCGRICSSDEGEYIDDEGFFCDTCTEDHQYGVYDYGYKPTPIFHRIGYHGWNHRAPDGNEPLYLGVELEVDDGNDTSCVANKYCEDDIYCKHDGSLGRLGFEIVSHPRTLEAHKEFDWDDVIKTCINSSYTSHDAGTCGLHVHVNRAFYGESRNESDFAAAKIIILVSRFWDELLLPFSRRTEYQLSRWACKPNSLEVVVPDDDQDAINNKIRRARSTRYKAVNLINVDTIEFRLFRGTLKYDTFIATLELVDGICHWVKNHTLEETLNISCKDFLAGEEFAEFDTMRDYIKLRNIQIENGLDDEEDI